MAAKQNDRIITTLEPEATTQKQVKHQQKPGKDWKPVVEEIVRASEKMREVLRFRMLLCPASGQCDEWYRSVVQRSDGLEEIWRLKQQVRKALSRLQKFWSATDNKAFSSGCI